MSSFLPFVFEKRWTLVPCVCVLEACDVLSAASCAVLPVTDG